MITYEEAGLSVVFPHKFANLQSCCDYMTQKRTNVHMVSTGTISTPKFTKISQKVQNWISRIRTSMHALHTHTHICHRNFLRKESRIKIDLIAVFYNVIQKINAMTNIHNQHSTIFMYVLCSLYIVFISTNNAQYIILLLCIKKLTPRNNISHFWRLTFTKLLKKFYSLFKSWRFYTMFPSTYHWMPTCDTLD